MLYNYNKEKIKEVELKEVELDNNSYWGLFSFDEINDIKGHFKIRDEIIMKALNHASTRFESHDGFDFICLNAINYKNVLEPFCKVHIYIKHNLILFITDKTQVIQEIFNDIMDDASKSMNFDRPLYTFLDKITANDGDLLDNIEQGIEELEDEIITTQKREYIREIIMFRKQLMTLKRSYEQLLNVLDAIQENENNIYDKNSMRFFKIIQGRIDRAYHSVLNLRDYVTQLREAYQAQVDINLNSIMKLFTVLSAIFMPLTLLVGWYGMNLKMPEYGWNHAYPMMIVLSVMIVGSSLIYFKIKKWF